MFVGQGLSQNRPLSLGSGVRRPTCLRARGGSNDSFARSGIGRITQAAPSISTGRTISGDLEQRRTGCQSSGTSLSPNSAQTPADAHGPLSAGACEGRYSSARDSAAPSSAIAPPSWAGTNLHTLKRTRSRSPPSWSNSSGGCHRRLGYF